MQRSKLFPVLNTLSKSELEDFEKFLHSPYHNQSPSAARLFDVIRERLPDYCPPTKLELHKKLSSERPFKESTMKDLVGKLYKLLKEFLAFERFKRKSLEMDFFLLDELRERGLAKISRNQLSALERNLRVKCGIDSNMLNYWGRIEANRFNLATFGEKGVRQNTIRKQIRALKRSEMFLTVSLAIEIYSDWLNLIMLANKYDLPNELGMTKEILNMVDVKRLRVIFKENIECTGILFLYDKLLTAFADFNNINAYCAYKRTFKRLIPKLGRDEVSFHYSKLMGYCILKMNTCQNDYDYKKELFLLYEEFLMNRYFINSKTKYLPAALFRDIIITACRLKEYDWAKKFTETYSRYLPERHCENMLNWGNAFISIARGAIEEGAESLAKVKPNDVILKYDINVLSLKILLGRKDLFHIPDALEKFRKNISDDRILPPQRKVKYKNFIRYYKQLLLAKDSQDNDIDMYRLKLLPEREIADKEWLVEKMYEMSRAARKGQKKGGGMMNEKGTAIAPFYNPGLIHSIERSS